MTTSKNGHQRDEAPVYLREQDRLEELSRLLEVFCDGRVLVQPKDAR